MRELDSVVGDSFKNIAATLNRFETTGAAVMKMNYELGFRPVPFALLTDDPEFWKGCQGCRNFPILESNQYKMCLCTGLLYDPAEHIEVESPALTK